MRLRFTLRALFVLVTLLVLGLVFVAWQKRAVDTRKGLLSFILANSGGYMAAGDVANNTLNIDMKGILQMSGDETAFSLQTNPNDPGPLRRWLGDTAIRIIWLPTDRPTRDLEEPIAVVFPEAEVRHRKFARGKQIVTAKSPLQLPFKPVMVAPQN